MPPVDNHGPTTLDEDEAVRALMDIQGSPLSKAPASCLTPNPKAGQKTPSLTYYPTPQPTGSPSDRVFSPFNLWAGFSPGATGALLRGSPSCDFRLSSPFNEDSTMSPMFGSSMTPAAMRMQAGQAEGDAVAGAGSRRSFAQRLNFEGNPSHKASNVWLAHHSEMLRSGSTSSLGAESVAVKGCGVMGMHEVESARMELAPSDSGDSQPLSDLYAHEDMSTDKDMLACAESTTGTTEHGFSGDGFAVTASRAIHASSTPKVPITPMMSGGRAIQGMGGSMSIGNFHYKMKPSASKPGTFSSFDPSADGAVSGLLSLNDGVIVSPVRSAMAERSSRRSDGGRSTSSLSRAKKRLSASRTPSYPSYSSHDVDTISLPDSNISLADSDPGPFEKAVNGSCSCRKSGCLKLYCECFRLNRYCTDCRCVGCFNKPEHEAQRQEAIKKSTDRKPQQDAKQSRGGCRCKRSGCSKKYCECFEAGRACTALCGCYNCHNTPHDRECMLHEQEQKKAAATCKPRTRGSRGTAVAAQAVVGSPADYPPFPDHPSDDMFLSPGCIPVPPRRFTAAAETRSSARQQHIRDFAATGDGPAAASYAMDMTTPAPPPPPFDQMFLSPDSIPVAAPRFAAAAETRTSARQQHMRASAAAAQALGTSPAPFPAVPTASDYMFTGRDSIPVAAPRSGATAETRSSARQQQMRGQAAIGNAHEFTVTKRVASRADSLSDPPAAKKRAVRRQHERRADEFTVPVFGPRSFITKKRAMHVFSYLDNDDMGDASLVSRMWNKLTLEADAQNKL